VEKVRVQSIGENKGFYKAIEKIIVGAEDEASWS
jgi:hypothetical protein